MICKSVRIHVTSHFQDYGVYLSPYSFSQCPVALPTSGDIQNYSPCCFISATGVLRELSFGEGKIVHQAKRKLLKKCNGSRKRKIKKIEIQAGGWT
jgi:hypothetical protein